MAFRLRLFTHCCILLGFFTLFLITPAHADQLSVKLDPKKHVLLMRHAIAPGIGDPANFTIGRCNTQRNLSNKGIAQAKNIGKALQTMGAKFKVYTSQWCRCIDTAKALALGSVIEQPLLNSFFRDGDNGGQQTLATTKWISELKHSKVPLLVTHQVNITAITGIYPASGEVIIIEKAANGIAVKHRISIDY